MFQINAVVLNVLFIKKYLNASVFTKNNTEDCIIIFEELYFWLNKLSKQRLLKTFKIFPIQNFWIVV